MSRNERLEFIYINQDAISVFFILRKEMEVMNVNDFYKARKCKKILHFDKQMENKNRRPFILHDLLSDICKMQKERKNEDEIKKHILFKLGDYESEWFSYPWQKVTMQNLDYMLLIRFLNWWKENFSNCTLLEENKMLSVSLNGIELESKVHLVVKKDGVYAGIRLSFSAHRKSLNGRSMRTNSATDLNNMVVKAALEETYPGIIIYDISIKNGEDTSEGISRNFTCGDTASCNVHVMNYSDFYESGTFQADVFIEKMNLAANENESVSCYGCQYETLCQQQTAELSVSEKANTYKLPSFTKEQTEVISFKEGCMSVIAGPGSGKTATLVGRICRLIDKEAVPSDYILVLSFSNEAVKELRSRCESLLPAWKQPRISTINALAYEILMRNQNSFECKYELLSEDKELALIETLTKAFGRICGVNYNLTKGKNGVAAQLARRLHAYKENPKGFFQKYPDMGEDFVAFYKEYDAIVKARGYIDFDSQITLAIKHLREHDAVTNAYRAMFRYIMVDEYQDVNKAQQELISILAGEHPNLVVVGDDDQNIYRFLGGSADFLRSFACTYQASCVKLTENFRSSTEIVNTAAKVVSGSSGRIEKDITAKRRGVAPIVKTIDNEEASLLNAVKNAVDELINNGLTYGEIAMLSYSNKALGIIQKNLAGEIPMRLAKTYLKDDLLFSYLYAILSLYYREDDALEEKAFLSERWGVSATLEELYRKHPYIKSVTGSQAFLNLVSDSLNAFDTVSRNDISDFISEWKLYDTKKLYEKMEYMKRYEDTTRASMPRVNRVTLSTCHDAKGREWKAVIVLDGEVYNKAEESDRNLLYVAVTRAKEFLYVICKGKDNFSDFLK